MVVSAMAKNLDCIPYDVFYQVASTLDCQDLIHLSRVNRTLNHLIQNESIARKAIQNDLLHTKEGQQASQAKTGYRNALGRLFDIKESFATAQPYSASILAYGSSFLYSDCCLCYIYNEEIRLLDVHGASQVEQVLNIQNVLSRAIPECNPQEDTIQICLMHYSDGILAFTVELVDRPEAWLLAMDMRRKVDHKKSGRLRLLTRLRHTRRLFVRHNASYLYYGTHTAMGDRGYPQWAINCVDLKKGQPTTDKPVVLENFAGCEIGQTVCFDIHQDHLYAVSTLVDFEAEEVDWTSYYVWLCLSPQANDKRRYIMPNRTWRRQHREGPINDTWSDLTLRHDEATKRLMILECRREWRDGGSENARTYYMQPLPSPAEVAQQKQPGPGPAPNITPVALPDEPLTRTLDSTNKPNYEPPRKRLRRHFHQEYAQGVEPAQRRDYILAKTQFRSYNLSASTFVDLVNDPSPERPGSFISHDRLRVRVVSRKRKCPIDEAGDEGEPGLLFQPELSNADGQPVQHSEERYASRGVSLWPPDDAPRELTQLLCPSKRCGPVQAAADERSLVYSVDQDGLEGTGNQAIVLINFDPSLRLPGLQRMDLTRSGAPPTDECNAPVGMERPRIGDIGRERVGVHTSLGSRRANQPMPSVREEKAMYLSIRRGYWLR
ncbi:hypothetical protein BO78DRAFT_385579 [Aspergillus sclerotiicarbonarius CBS 121057]|uniref:F-box domain-containing protein n=1 Tax=Aspergillus sclerotiicarbonarius (strain CBS 121057 / IBT 28362) TaxID=1448318 RepID=A0A319ECE1_ASPSB|nr:hypothetical protein BO78DRAFT_385579 [Aspergillus sclerotiicarbonarius CBS 121057]